MNDYIGKFAAIQKHRGLVMEIIKVPHIDPDHIHLEGKVIFSAANLDKWVLWQIENVGWIVDKTEIYETFAEALLNI